MKKIFLVLLCFGCSLQAWGNVVGFLTDGGEGEAFIGFQSTKNGGWEIARSLDFGSSRTMNIFFDGKTLGQVEVKTPYGCRRYTPFTKDELQKRKKICEKQKDWANSVVPPPPPEPEDDLCLLEEDKGHPGPVIDCPPAASKDIEVIDRWPVARAKVPPQLKPSLEKPFLSKKIHVEGRVLTGEISRPLLLTSQTSSDPEGWTAREFKTFPEQVRHQVLKEVLRTRGVQKCTLPKSPQKSIVLTEKDLEIGRAYRTRSGDRFAIPVAVKTVKDLSKCNDEEGWGISAAFVVYSSGKAVDLINPTVDPLRNLEVLEAADINGDGVSELFFADSGYNSGGFSFYDFRAGKLFVNTTSSH